MAGSVLSVLTDVLKNMYLGPINEQLNNEVLLSQLLQLDSKSVDLVGLQAVVPLHVSRSGGIGSRDELDTLPNAGNQAYKKAVYDLKYHYARIQVSGQAMQKTKSNVGAFLQAYQSELDGIRNDVAIDQARQMYGDGTGAIATCSASVGPVATITLTSNEAIVKGYLYEGMVVDIGTFANPTLSATAATITDVDEVNSQVTFSANVTVTINHVLTRSGNNKTSATKEIDAGLQNLIATTANTVGGLDSSAAGNKQWQNQFDTSGGAISLDNLMKNLNKVNRKGVTMSDLVVLCSQGITRALFGTADFKSLVRFVDTTDLAGGFEQISFAAGQGKVTLTTDRLAPWGRVFFIPKANFRLFSPGGWDFLAKDGQAVKWVQNQDAFQSILFRYANLGTNRRNNSLVMSGLTDTGV